MILRNHQSEIIEMARESIRNGNKSIVIHAPCGFGKTICAAAIIKSAIEKGKRVIFLVHFRQLAYQAMQRFEAFGLGDQCSYIMAGEETKHDKPIQIISVQTYGRRLKLDSLEMNRWFKEADLVFYDECHAAIAKTRKEILELYKDNAIILGLTASPCRSDSRGLGEVFDDIVSNCDIGTLTKKNFLVPVRYFGATHLPDLNNIPEIANEFNQKELGKRVNKKKLVGDILENWLKIAPDRSTVIFATNVKHSLHIKELFSSHGINIAHIDARTPSDERYDILKRFESGDIQVITNCAVFSEGADFAWCSTIVLAKPVKSYGRYIQMAGRGLRIHPGKEDCIIIDHSGCVQLHGFLDEPMEWSLEGKELAWQKPKRKDPVAKPVKCRVCHQIFIGVKKCNVCGTELKTFGRKVETVDAELKELKGKKKNNRNMSYEDKALVYGAFLYHAEIKGYSRGWASHSYKSYFNVWPNDPRVKNMCAVKPEGKIKNILTHMLIKKSAQYRKEKANAETKNG